MTENEKRIERNAIANEQQQDVQATLLKVKILAKAARYLESNADRIMNAAHTSDPQVKHVIMTIANSIRNG